MLQRGNKPQQNGQGDAGSKATPILKNNTVKEIGTNIVSNFSSFFTFPIFHLFDWFICVFR